MSEVEVQEPVCGKCGVEVRPDTAFCYNCGAAVTQTAPDVMNGAKHAGEEILGAENEIPGAIDDAEARTANGGSVRLEDRRPAAPKYESAAGLRKRSKPEVRKPVEVTWEPQTESPNLTFIIATICLLALAVILIVAAQYLR